MSDNFMNQEVIHRLIALLWADVPTSVGEGEYLLLSLLLLLLMFMFFVFVIFIVIVVIVFIIVIIKAYFLFQVPLFIGTDSRMGIGW